MFTFEVKDNQFRTPSKGWCGNRPNCVAVARTEAGIAIRDTKDSSKQTLFFDKEEFAAFVGAVKAGEFDV